MPRSTSEWISKTPDDKVPARVRLRIWRRQCGDANFAICPLSGMPLRADDEKHLHHSKALILGGAHAESNLVFVHAKANLDQAKQEVAERAKNDDRAKAHAGLNAPARSSLSGPCHAEKRAQKDARSKDRAGPGKLPVPVRPQNSINGFRVR